MQVITMELINDLYDNLRILSKIHKQGQKLNLENKLTICEPNIFSAFQRRLYGENRDRTIQFLKKIHELSNHKFTMLCVDYNRELKDLSDVSDQTQINGLRSCQELIKFYLLVNGAKEGIQVLFKTYQVDPRCVAILEGIIDDFVDLLKRIDALPFIKDLRPKSNEIVELHQILNNIMGNQTLSPKI
jgi:hypothetical protein